MLPRLIEFRGHHTHFEFGDTILISATWLADIKGDPLATSTLCAAPSKPCHARLDAPDTLHHLMVRGLERRASSQDDSGRAEFVARLAGQAGCLSAAARGLSHQAVTKAATGGERIAARWQAPWDKLR